ncbi:MAG TPA: ornithine cyclodeaminase family protein [Candidatus Acidoferrales bacterium]|nr:ornithine cyclodeaminase family protein [Candidatus Acidoferrales bacterium]
MPLLLTREEVRPLLDLAKAVELTEAAFHEQANGDVVPHAPYHIPFKTGGVLRVVSGALLGSRRAGVRLGPAQGLGGDRMYALLFDSVTGDLLSVMSYPFGTLRTAAHVALAARHMARADAQTVGLLGSGRNAFGLLEGILLMRKITRVTVFSRDPERRKAFCARATEKLTVDVVPADGPEQAVRANDLVLTATNSLAGLFPAEYLEPGMHVSSMGKPSELGPDVYLKADRVVVGCKEHERNYFDRAAPLPLETLDKSGKLRWEQIHEMGDVVSGRIKGREKREEITLFRESQGGFGDVAFAAWIYDEAKRRGLGKEIAF